jgi:hypothetical protein
MEAIRVPLVHLASAPVDLLGERNDWAKHLPEDDDRDGPVIQASFCVLVRSFEAPLTFLSLSGHVCKLWIHERIDDRAVSSVKEVPAVLIEGNIKCWPHGNAMIVIAERYDDGIGRLLPKLSNAMAVAL